ncbi:hypothetical protein [Ureibacillus endophyticus]|uniref:Uncharacterized protein n=1 Tax=Ureibacillus endophyticus TaxID=1978490 RepID=A0A494YRQ7_9BACL|nr:hypothetical protein [Lysinibacillus endophyticus]RKQ12275.1 hypothetical protein D8M03_17145 [Lysinibacillus endophyticus]
MSNTVIKGDYLGYTVINNGINISLNKLFKNTVILNENTVETYEVITEESKTSVSSAALRGGAGAVLLGPIGLAAAFTARKKGIYTVVIVFKDGKKSVVELKEKEFKTFRITH